MKFDNVIMCNASQNVKDDRVEMFLCSKTLLYFVSSVLVDAIHEHMIVKLSLIAICTFMRYLEKHPCLYLFNFILVNTKYHIQLGGSMKIHRKASTFSVFATALRFPLGSSTDIQNKINVKLKEIIIAHRLT